MKACPWVEGRENSKAVTGFLRRLVNNRWFSLGDLLLVIMSGATWILIPKFGIWLTLIALLPKGLRFLSGGRPFQRTPFDWLIATFLLTAWIAYWGAYDRGAAWIKVWLIVTTVLLYYAVAAQPKENLGWLSAASFCLALGLSIYFLLTHDFAGSRAAIALWWMKDRPQVGWPAMPHEYASGLLIFTSLIGSYWLLSIGRKSGGYFTLAIRLLLFLGIGMIVWAFLLTTSRGILAVVLGILVSSILRIAPAWAEFMAKARVRSVFPTLVLVGLAVLIVFVYLGPARAADPGTPGDYGGNSRAELFGRAAYFLADYPITGGGLSSFPGLYSQYILVIPNFYFINSYNVFLDVAVEQGLLGGAALILIYLGSIWLVARMIVNTPSRPTRFFGWLSLFALIFAVIHGLFYDYLYNGNGTLLLMLPAGISIMGVQERGNFTDESAQSNRTFSLFAGCSTRTMILLSVLGLILILGLNRNKVISIWYSDLGAVQMSQVELKHFPTNHWAEPGMVPDLERPQDLLRTAVAYDPGNETANYRLGIISMLRQDFPAAAKYLESARAQAPNHRGISKSLGYCYVWLGDFENAQMLLANIPEAKRELSIYVWWWGAQGQPDLAEKASVMVSRLVSSP